MAYQIKKVKDKYKIFDTFSMEFITEPITEEEVKDVFYKRLLQKQKAERERYKEELKDFNKFYKVIRY